MSILISNVSLGSLSHVEQTYLLTTGKLGRLTLQGRRDLTICGLILYHFAKTV